MSRMDEMGQQFAVFILRLGLLHISPSSIPGLREDADVLLFRYSTQERVRERDWPACGRLDKAETHTSVHIYAQTLVRSQMEGIHVKSGQQAGRPAGGLAPTMRYRF